MDSIDALSRSRCREWRLNNQVEFQKYGGALASISGDWGPETWVESRLWSAWQFWLCDLFVTWHWWLWELQWRDLRLTQRLALKTYKSVTHYKTLIFYRASAHWRAILISIMSVCLSVCPWRSGIRWKRLNIIIVILSSLHGSPIILVLSASNIFTKFL